jgi:hypothetical protein
LRDAHFFVDLAGVYGTKGVGTTSTVPGARYVGQFSISPNGDFWLFGGYGVANDTYNGGESILMSLLILFLISIEKKVNSNTDC